MTPNYYELKFTRSYCFLLLAVCMLFMPYSSKAIVLADIEKELNELQDDTLKVKYLRKVLVKLDDAKLGEKVILELNTLTSGIEDSKWSIKSLKSEAKFYYNINQEKTCRATLKEAFKLAQSEKQYALQVEVLFTEIDLFFEGGRLEDAVPKSKYLFPILSKIKSKEVQAQYLSLLGRKFYSLGDYPEAMKYYVQSQDIFEKNSIKNSDYGHLLHNIGSVFKRQDNLEKALEYYEQELALGKEMKDEMIVAEGLYLAAGMYAELGQIEKGREYNKKAIAIFEDAGNMLMVSLISGNMAIDYAEDGQLNKAISMLEKSLVFFEQAKEYDKIAWIQKDLAGYHSELGHHELATNYINKASKNALKTSKKQLLRKTEIAKTLSFIHYRKGDYKKAFDSYMDYIALEDSLTNNERLKLIGELESKYENEKNEAEIALLNKDKKIKAAELKRAAAEVKEQKLMRNGMFVIIGLVLIVSLVIYRGYRINKKNNLLLSQQNDEINLKNLIIEEKNKNITDPSLMLSEFRKQFFHQRVY